MPSQTCLTGFGQGRSAGGRRRPANRVAVGADPAPAVVGTVDAVAGTGGLLTWRRPVVAAIRTRVGRQRERLDDLPVVPQDPTSCCSRPLTATRARQPRGGGLPHHEFRLELHVFVHVPRLVP